MKADIQYEAVSPNKSGLFSHEDIDRLAKLGWMAMGIYQYLLLHGAKSLVELGRESPLTPYTEISKGLDQLIELGLIEEVSND